LVNLDGASVDKPSRLNASQGDTTAWRLLEACGTALLAGLLACVGWTNLSWAAGGQLSGTEGLFAGAVCAVACMAFALRGRTLRHHLFAALVVAGAAAVSLVLAEAVRDFSYDGQRYHQEAVQALAAGWNPLRDAPLQGNQSLWINGYAKGPWIWSAVWLHATGSIELGKSLHLWLAISAAFLVYGTLRRLPALSPAAAGSIALLAAANPVLLCQWPTHMNDSLIGSLLLVLASQAGRLSLMIPDADDKAMAWLTAGLGLALLPTVKASGLAYAALASMTGWVAALLWRRVDLSQHLLKVAATSLVTSVLVLSWNPYVTNTVRHGHPFYPLGGEGKVDIITNNSPNELHGENRVMQWLGSIFSQSHSELGTSEKPALRPKWPGVVSAGELAGFVSKTDMRIGGFGPWFSLGLVLALAGAVVALFEMTRRAGWRSTEFRRGVAAGATLPAGLLVLTLAFPEPWWARYIPQMFLLPIALLAAVLAAPLCGRLARGLAWVSLAVLTVNSLAVGSAFSVGAAVRELDMRTQLGSAASLSSPTRPLPVRLTEPALARRLSQAGVHWRPAADEEPCAQWVTLHHSGVGLCLPPGHEGKYIEEAPAVTSLKRLLRGR
jgi:hypothetical protein